MPQIHRTICNFCDSVCGIVVEAEGERVLSVRGDPDDPFSRGHICPKGVAQKDIHGDPDRLRQPLRRNGDRWEPLAWDEAIDLVGGRLAAIQRDHGRDAVAMYYGNPVGHNYQSMLALIGLYAVLGTKNVFSSSSLDAHPRTLASFFLYGNQGLLPVPDIERTELLVIMGANPLVSHGSIMTAPDTRKRLKELRDRGARIVVIDPRRSETAAVADRHHFIRPGSDAALLLAMLHEFNRTGAVRPAQPHLLKNLDTLLEAAREFPPERVAAFVGMSATAIRALAAEFVAAPRAVWYGRMGTCTQPFGSVCSWLIDAINLLSGNFDRPGGAMFTTPALDLAGLARLLRQPGGYGRWHSRVAGLPEVNGEFPVVTMADEMMTPGRGQVRALVSVAGNPVLSSPNGRRLDQALAVLDFMVAMDMYVNESTRHAHVILPPPTLFEQNHYPLIEYAVAIRNVARYGERLFDPPPDARPDGQTLVALAAALLRHRGGWQRWLSPALATLSGPLEDGRLLDVLLRLGPRRLRLSRLAAAPHGLDFGALEPRLERVLNTRDHRVDLAPPVLLKDLDRLRAAIAATAPSAGAELLLISRRTMNSMNSWLHNSPLLVAGKPRCRLQMHPADAAARGLNDGQTVRVASRVGNIDVPLDITDDVMPGVVSLPYGWGHDRPGARMRVAARRAGASMNDVVDERAFDRVSGTAVLDGVPVLVSSAIGATAV